jgi:hypothetical protein
MRHNLHGIAFNISLLTHRSERWRLSSDWLPGAPAFAGNARTTHVGRSFSSDVRAEARTHMLIRIFPEISSVSETAKFDFFSGPLETVEFGLISSVATATRTYLFAYARTGLERPA